MHQVEELALHRTTVVNVTQAGKVIVAIVMHKNVLRVVENTELAQK